MVAKATPQTIYCAFIQYVLERLVPGRTLRDANRWLPMSSRESTHGSRPTKLAGGRGVARHLGAVETIARE